MSQTVVRRQRGIATKFTPEEKSRHFAELGRISNAGRLILTYEEAASLASAYELLARVAERARAKVATTQDSDRPESDAEIAD
jgi:hypothetical protein